MIVGYARVSTADQDLATQLEALAAAGADKIYQEKISGAKRDRKELDRLLADLRPGDVLIVKRCDRLARSTHDMLSILKLVDKAGAAFKSLTEAWADTSTAHGRLIITVMSGIAEFERELILDRTNEGRKRALAAGVKFGRKEKLTPHEKEMVVIKLEAGQLVTDLAFEFDVSPRTIKRVRATTAAPDTLAAQA